MIQVCKWTLSHYFCQIKVRAETAGLSQIHNCAQFIPVGQLSESGMITYLIQTCFSSDFYLTEIQACIKSVYMYIQICQDFA